MIQVPESEHAAMCGVMEEVSKMISSLDGTDILIFEVKAGLEIRSLVEAYEKFQAVQKNEREITKRMRS
jgi:hypothetical protein